MSKSSQSGNADIPPHERSIKITYKDGKFIIITSTLMDVAYGIVEVFDSNGYPIEYIGEPRDRDEYVALVNKYFEHKTT